MPKSDRDSTEITGTVEDYQFIIESQRSVFVHVQSQAQSIFRSFLAALAIVVAFSSIGPARIAFADLLDYKSLLVSSVDVSNTAYSAELFNVTVILNLFVIVGLLLMSGFLSLDILVQAHRILQSDFPYPAVSDKNHRMESNQVNEKINQYKSWARKNEQMLSGLEVATHKAFYRLPEAVFVVLFTILLLWTITVRSGHGMALSNLILITPAALVIAFGILEIGYAFYQDRGTKSVLRDRTQNVRENLENWSPSEYVNAVLLSTYSMIVILSIFILYLWIVEVWVPMLVSNIPLLVGK